MSKFYLKVIVPSVLSILLFILTIFLIIIPHYRQSIMNGKREMIKELTNSAWSILSKYENDEKSGLFTREDAQKTAASRIQYLRYGEENKDYFWITDLHPNMIMHPYRTDLNGKDLTNFSDPHGKKLFVELVNTVKNSEHGYVDYMWQWKDDSLHIVPKLSYVRLFKPWGWVIGTGIYIEDVKKEIDSLTNKLLYISLGISALIAFLLLFISQQSLKIERQRIRANIELHESKEKYRTLVEAATEGLLMIIDGKISFSNNIICKLSGYTDLELTKLPIKELISDNNNKDIINTFSKKIVKEGQYELNLKKKNGEFLEVLVNSSTAIINDKAVNILIVKDISVDNKLNLSALEYQKLLSTLDIGFFRTNIDTKGKFVFANDTAIRILGYENFRELSETNIIRLFADAEDRKALISEILEKGFAKNKILKIRRNNKQTSFVSVTLVVYKSEDSGNLICDGIIEDITKREIEKSETNNLIARLKSSSFLIEQPVKNFVTPLYSIDSDSTINDAVRLLAKKNTDCLLIVKNEKDYIGIITNRDIQGRVVQLDLNLDNPVYLIMNSPVIYLKEETRVFEAINICEEKKINHPVIKNEAGIITGILRMYDIHEALKESLSFFIAETKNAETTDDLKKNYNRLQLFVKALIKSDISTKYITGIMTAFSDAATKKIIELTIKDIGKPPVPFSFICMGSEGRCEETLFTDQDNAIIYENVQKEKESFVRTYFNKLGEKICNSLDYIGYKFCKGNIMAGNPTWCQPLSVWEKYFTEWITTPEPQNLLDATIFFDLRNIYGDEDITDRLRQTIETLVKENPLFLYHLAYNTYNTKLQHTASNIVSDKSTDFIDLKDAVNPIVMFSRVYSLQSNIRCTNTIERLFALKDMNIVNANTADEIIFAYNYLMKLRFRNQAELLENTLPLSNVINTKNLIDIESAFLKKIISLIPVYQNKIRVDFRITT